MFESYLVRPRKHFSSDRLLNIFGPIRIGPGALLAPTPSPRTWSNFYMGPKAHCMILGLCPYTCRFEMLDYCFKEFVLIYSLYFVCYYLFRGRFKKIDIGFINLGIV